MVSRVAGAAKKPRTCPRCGVEHWTYGTRYCYPCYKARENEKAWARGRQQAAPIPEIVLGEKYGAWVTVQEPEAREGGGQWGTQNQVWGCVCEECGEERSYSARSLGKLPSCPTCRRRERALVHRVKEARKTKAREAREAERERRRELARQRIEEAKRQRAEQALSHSKHPLYPTWQGFRSRCLNPKDSGYPNYGGRGIGVCVEWAKSFEPFRDYCEEHLGPKPEGMSIDRIDNEGHYEPGNVRWATPKEQASNTRSNLMLTIGGVTKRFLEWVEDYGLDQRATDRARSRLTAGWDVEIALTAPDGYGRDGEPLGGFTEKQIEEIEARGLTISLVRERLTRGWPLKKAMEAPRGTVHMKMVECWLCGEFGHIASSHPEYEEWLARKLGRTLP